MKPLDLSLPHLIIMIGIPGSGKSFFAENFAKTFKAPLISFDKISNSLSNINIDKKTLAEAINHIMLSTLIETSKANRTIIYDGQNITRTSCEGLIKITKSLGYAPMFIWVQTDIETAKKRATKPITSKIPITQDDFDKILKQFNPIDRTKKNYVVISGKHTYSNQLKIVLKYLSQLKK